jgi:hypothetical protein
MEKIKKLAFLFFLFMMIGKTNAQETPIIRKGLLRVQGTICPAYLISEKESTFYLHGNLEGYVSPKISFAGEVYYSLGNPSGNNSIFEFNHSLFFGSSYHFTKKNNDLYIGIQPGLSFTKNAASEENFGPTQMGVNPLLSSLIGYNFYVNKFFHFFLQSRVVFGQHNFDVRRDLSEFRFSAGLGFNINALKTN